MNRPAPSWPLPQVIDVDREFWNGIQAGRLLIPKCRDCGRRHFFPRPACPECLGANLEWEPASGRGTVYSFSLVRVPRAPAVRAHVEATGVPVIFVEVRLNEGVRVLAQLVGTRPEDVTLGMPVAVAFEPPPGTEFKLPCFRPV
jgi:uncharacterized OB-fold protein